ncbi:hypothetical protein I203_102087 [Kwoniella mangroviensis CBS 8507]|uniref:uncharacterized protein n=1 Tax=Kwoniella mangroviensis CBS 8507 TaxID=1296122 RepID=UPI00080D503D|nr:uncharacterized protein I203_03282 [Kwoniella mangroviensis CBS 8507]OCF67585.1 hypothetical protein I203_03282 [Kwoniella mangroviensis CBS 8507]
MKFHDMSPLGPIALSATTPDDQLNATNPHIAKRDGQVLWGGYYGPQPSEIKVSQGSKKKRFSAFQPESDDANGKIDSLDVEVYNIDASRFQKANSKHSDIKDENSLSGDPWWIGAYEIAAQQIGGNEYTSKDGFDKDADADIGLRMLTGLESMTSEPIKGDDEGLWDILKKGKESSICLKKGKQWYGVTGIEGELKDGNVKVTLYDTKKGECKSYDFDDLDIKYYSILKGDDKL